MKRSDKIRGIIAITFFSGLLLEPLSESALAMGQSLASSHATPTYRESLSINPADFSAQNAALTIRYQIECQSDRYQMVPGELSYEGRVIRFDLFSARSETTVLIGKPSAAGSINLTLMSGTDCSAKLLSTQIEQMMAAPKNSDSDLAMLHAPFLNVRPDQVENRYTDLPIALAYSITPSDTKGNKKLRYTIFFTDEDSVGDSNATEFQMARYGRRTDVEWIYEVELDRNGQVIRRQYQGGLITKGPLEGAGHATYPFKGSFVDGQHPVLYNVANHNVFSDKPLDTMRGLPFIGYQLLPSEAIECCAPREVVMTRNPWMYKVSDVELAREGKLSKPSTRYLYVSVAGKLQGSLNAVVVMDDRSELIGNEGHGNLDRLGEDLWNKESFVAIPISESILQGIESTSAHGALYFADVSEHAPEALSNTIFKPSDLKFFLIRTDDSKGYRYEDISKQFKCLFSGLETVCRF
jgi:hypothetical protein